MQSENNRRINNKHSMILIFFGFAIGCILTIAMVVITLDGMVCGDVAMDIDDFVRLMNKAHGDNIVKSNAAIGDRVFR